MVLFGVHGACHPARPTAAPRAQETTDAAVGGSRAVLDAAVPAYPADWTVVAPGVRWRGVRMPWTDAGSPGRVWGSGARNLDWVVVRLDLARVSLRVVRALDDRLDGATADTTVLAAVDGGYFEPDHQPSGWLVSHGRTWGRGDVRGGSGVLVVAGGRATVVPSDGWDAGVLPMDGIAVQCGPRLVETGGVAGVHRDDGRRYARTAACVRDGGHTLDLVTTWDPAHPMEGPGLFHLANMLSRGSPVGDTSGCDLALNLDGGPSTGVYVKGGVQHAPLGPTPWVITVRRGTAAL